jgi:hypothetical protein
VPGAHGIGRCGRAKRGEWGRGGTGGKVVRVARWHGWCAGRFLFFESAFMYHNNSLYSSKTQV